MLCEKCKKRTATVFYNENINGKTKSYSLCGDCASKLREKGDLQDITSISETFVDPFSTWNDHLFGGFFGIPTLKGFSIEKKCPVCDCHYSEIAKTGKVGCPTCYEVFSDELSAMIASIHGTTAHTGNVPAKHRAIQKRANRLDALNKELKKAIQEENYETAAKLRDEIRSLQKEANEEGEG